MRRFLTTYLLTFSLLMAGRLFDLIFLSLLVVSNTCTHGLKCSWHLPLPNAYVHIESHPYVPREKSRNKV